MHDHQHLPSVAVAGNDDIIERVQEILDAFFEAWVETTTPMAEAVKEAIRNNDVDVRDPRRLRMQLKEIVVEWQDEMEATLWATVQESAKTGQQAQAEIFDLEGSFDIVPQRTLNALEEWNTTVSQSISDTISEDVTAFVEEATREGLSVEDMADVFEERYMDEVLHDYHAEQIARDVTVGPANAGSHEAHKSAQGVVGEQWNTQMDGRQRLSHGRANGQVVGVNELFDVGRSQLRFPHDPTAPISETTNCRCILLPAFKSDLSEEQLRTLQAGGTLWDVV